MMILERKKRSLRRPAALTPRLASLLRSLKSPSEYIEDSDARKHLPSCQTDSLSLATLANFSVVAQVVAYPDLGPVGVVMIAPDKPVVPLSVQIALPPIRVTADAIGFPESLDEWIALKCRGMRAWSRSCQLKAHQYRAAWVSILGDVNLLDIVPQHIERLFILRSELRRSGQTLNLERKYFRAYWRWPMRMRYLPRERDLFTDSWPCVSSEPVRRYIELSQEEERKLLAELSGEARRAVAFGLLMGLRVSEIYNLKWSMVVGCPGCLSLAIPAAIRKQRHAHTMPITAKAEAVLGTRGASDSIFTLPNQRNLLSALKRVAKRVGIDQAISMHQLRRTWCSRLADAGVPMAAAQRLGGWSSITVMLKHYYVLPVAKAREFMERL